LTYINALSLINRVISYLKTWKSHRIRGGLGVREMS